VLVHLHIRDVATIEEVELGLGPGLTVLTGETGAGKSLIVGAAGLLRGGRASAELIRTGAAEALVEAVFDLSRQPVVVRMIQEAGLPLDGGELLVRRVVSRNGRGRVHLNGALGTVALLGRLTGALLDISGQHEHQTLTERSTHREILDAMIIAKKKSSVASALPELQEAHRILRRALDRLAQSRLDDQQRIERIDFLGYQLRELEDAALIPGEDLELERERTRLSRAAELIEAATVGERELYGEEGSAADRLASVRRRLDDLSGVDPALDPLARQLEEAHALVEDVALTLARFGGGIEADPARQEQLEERLDLLHRLRRKHGGTLAEVLTRQAAMRSELDDLLDLEHSRDALERGVEEARAVAERLAIQITESRKEAASRLQRIVNKALTGLRMKGARLTVRVGPRAPRADDDRGLCFGDRRLGPTGWDDVEFLIATNKGEEPRPLRRVASGGELSRVMLALRKGLGAHDPVATSIYDEVDAGISGAVADVVGRGLAEVARHRQVICVTHLPQVAAHASAHLTVGKRIVQRRARTEVASLEGKARVEELARMLGGEQVTAQARANARRMLSDTQ
jgi:DNA repair protein RecN (Recombination protein N)